LQDNELCHTNDVEVVDSDVKETGRAEGDDGRSHIAIGNDLDAEYIGYGSSVVFKAYEKKSRE